MRLSVRREPKGRHALGAAVTAIPSAPVRVPVAVPPPIWSPTELEVDPAAAVQALPPPPPLPPAPVQSVPPAPEPAPAAPEPPAVAPVVPAAVVVEPVVVEPVVPAPFTPQLPSLPVQSIDLELALLDLVGPLEFAASPAAPVEPPPAPDPGVPPVFVPPVQAGPVEPPAAAPLAPPPAVPVPPAPAVPVPPAPSPAAPPILPAPPTGPRVELGFADGTFRMLDPASSAAQQLSHLVAELTDKGDGSRPSAS